MPVPVPASGPPGGLVGRAAELAQLGSFLDAALADGGALLLAGEPGVGTSALLGAAARHAAASGARVLRADGVELEAETGFAALHQLLGPLLPSLGRLPRASGEAIRVALGLRAGAEPERLLLSSAVLELLQAAAATRPVLLVVDDLHWVDGSSQWVLGFVARRAPGRRLGVLGAGRTEQAGPLLTAGLPTTEIRPLDEDAAAGLLEARFPTLAAPVRRRVLAAAQGNPLALAELPTVLTEAQRTGSAPLPPWLPLSARLRRGLARQLTALPDRTRLLLLTAALEGTGDLATLRATTADEAWLDDLAPAERAGLARVDLARGRVSLRPPLLGTAVVESATSGERRRTHAALAGALLDQPDRCAWHLARSVVGTDDLAAGLLEEAARRARRKGDVVRAVTAFVHAAELSAEGGTRARRLAAAAFVGAEAAGDLRAVPELLSEARDADPGTAGSTEVPVAAAHHLLNGEGDAATAHLLLVRAVTHALDRGAGPDTVDDALHSLLLVCHFGGREELWRPWEGALAALGAAVPPVLEVSRTVFADPVRATPEALARLDDLVATAHAEVDPSRVVRIATAALYADRVARCRPALWRVVRDGRGGGAVASAVHALVLLSYDAFEAGRWDEAERTAAEGIARGGELGYDLVTLTGVYCQALLAAARGDEVRAHALAEEMLRWATPRGLRVFEDFAARVRGLDALGRGDAAAAYEHLTRISGAGAFPPHAPVAVPVAMDLVEAAVRTGRTREAEAHVAAMSRAPLFADPAGHALAAAGSAALVASGEEAVLLFDRALALPGAARHPFQRARIRLAYGEHLRRARRMHAARTHLTGAAEDFRTLGAGPWVRRADAELRATGLARGGPEPGAAPHALTSQEHEIAMLAASGLSNKQIGSRLYLSPRTVSGHLYRVFPKLGITSRAALRDALGTPAGRAVEVS
ncbi:MULTISPECIES: AAA family ATPase [unclassified Blastococcus]